MREMNGISGFLQCNFKNTALDSNNAVRLSLRDSLPKINISPAHHLVDVGQVIFSNPHTCSGGSWTKKTLPDGCLW